MKFCVMMVVVIGLGILCSCTRSAPPAPVTGAVLVASEATPLTVAKEELKSRGQSLHDRLDFRVVEKDWGWIVTVGNLTGRQPKGQAYIPGDAVLIRIDKLGKVLEYTHVP
jgi:hypothetical protein